MNALLPEGAFAVLTKARALEAQGKKIIHFEIGQPDFPTPKSIVKAAKKALDKGMTRYTQPLGLPEFRKAVAGYLSKTRGIEFFENQIAATPSPKTAIFLTFAALVQSGDEVIYPDPGFPTYEVLSGFFGGIKRPVQLSERKNFSFDMEDFKAKFSPKTRLVVLNSPSNPTGGIMPEGDVREIAGLVLKNPNCFVLSDEIYSQILYDGNIHHSIAEFSGMMDRTFLVDGFSKTYSMTGWRLGHLAFPKKFEERMDWLITNTYSCAAHFSQLAGIEALTGPQDEVEKMVAEFAKRRDVIVEGLNSIPGITCRKPLGAFYVFPNVKSFGRTSRELADYILEKAGVALLDGTAFGKFGEGYLRLSYANSLENIFEGLNRITHALKK